MSEFGGLLKQSVTDTLSMFGLGIDHKSTEDSARLTSNEEVSLVLGFHGDLKGSIVFGMPRKTATTISSIMTGSLEFDFMAKSALSELSNMIAGSAVSKSTPFMNLSPPTFVSGKNMYLLISKVKSTALSFSINDDPFTVSFSIE